MRAARARPEYVGSWGNTFREEFEHRLPMLFEYKNMVGARRSISPTDSPANLPARDTFSTDGPEAPRCKKIPTSSRNCLGGSKNAGAAISISVRGRAGLIARGAADPRGPSGDAAKGPAMAEPGIGVFEDAVRASSAAAGQPPTARRVLFA
jgi:hypothetical protein